MEEFAWKMQRYANESINLLCKIIDSFVQKEKERNSRTPRTEIFTNLHIFVYFIQQFHFWPALT